ncbi:hypothetical protein ACQ4PT_061694 [Festuca glaucescens]
MTNGRWMRGPCEEQLDQFVQLWTLVQHVQLKDNRDEISWNLTADGKYSARSAYARQFIGRLMQPELEKAWSIRAEGKVKFFLWLALQNKNWTADRLRARGWPHSDTGSLCDQLPETASHLAMQCHFAKEVWNSFQGTNPSVTQLATSVNSILGWWRKATRNKSLSRPKKI